MYTLALDSNVLLRQLTLTLHILVVAAYLCSGRPSVYRFFTNLPPGSSSLRLCLNSGGDAATAVAVAAVASARRFLSAICVTVLLHRICREQKRMLVGE